MPLPIASVFSLNPFGLALQGSSKCCAVWAAHLASEIYKCRKVEYDDKFISSVCVPGMSDNVLILRSDVIMRAAAGVSCALGERVVVRKMEEVPIDQQVSYISLQLNGEKFFIRISKENGIAESLALDMPSLISYISPSELKDNIQLMQARETLVSQFPDTQFAEDLARIVPHLGLHLTDISKLSNLGAKRVLEILTDPLMLQYVLKNNRQCFKEKQQQIRPLIEGSEFESLFLGKANLNYL